ncbi:hypothetical protein NX02_09690 [Sphingomonas sanxanigenens DSM 19645 = NX02]|uniref:Uncharacterized protein n=1 Tax=Sphingomonas sanxanigenens DSM 19645 = NX02 TaxID=1123269 RepID=W0ABG8_9SPHN|nr:hypothetical protein NX02_09690 [Sphingomonas sanxanigenens DSM 19645 = NX02]
MRSAQFGQAKFFAKVPFGAFQLFLDGALVNAEFERNFDLAFFIPPSG